MAIAALARSAPGSAGGILLIFKITMNDDLPEIFDQVQPPPAPPHLRARTLAAVNGELAKHRKPRWERVLELSVAASFVLGVGLNVWQFSESSLFGGTRSTSIAAEQLAAGQRDGADSDGLTAQRPHRPRGPFDERYAKLLAELIEKPAG
jgi:hypothetical protein